MPPMLRRNRGRRFRANFSALDTNSTELFLRGPGGGFDNLDFNVTSQAETWGRGRGRSLDRDNNSTSYTRGPGSQPDARFRPPPRRLLLDRNMPWQTDGMYLFLRDLY